VSGKTAFFEITTTLACEINTLAYPKAALFAFCLALLAYNAVSLIKAALRRAHGRQKVNGNRSGIENLGLALQSRHGIPCHYGNIACPPARHVGADPT
jgi:hypothetical protein